MSLSNISKKQETEKVMEGDEPRYIAEGVDKKSVVQGAASGWLIVRPALGKESLLTATATSIGFDVYQPMVLKQRYNHIAHAMEWITAPMFPGFLLIRPTPKDAWRIFSLPGMRSRRDGVLEFALFNRVIRELRARERDGVIKALVPKPKPSKGEKVKTLGGMVDAVINEVDTNRISLVTSLFRGSARFSCGLDQIIRH